MAEAKLEQSHCAPKLEHSRERIAKALARLREQSRDDLDEYIWENPQDWTGTLRLAWEIRSMLMTRPQIRAEILSQVEILRNLNPEQIAGVPLSCSDANMLADICEDFANELLYPWRYE